MARLTDINRPITAAEFDPRKHIIYSTKEQKKEYKKRGMQLVSDAEKKRIARLVELDQRAQKIKDKEERKKKNALKRKAKEDKDKEKGIIHVPKKFKIRSSQCQLDGFFGKKRRKLEEEEEEEEEDDQEQEQEQECEEEEQEEEDDKEAECDNNEEELENGGNCEDEDNSLQPDVGGITEAADDDYDDDNDKHKEVKEEVKERAILGEVDVNVNANAPSRLGKRRSPKTSKAPPPRKSPRLQRKPTVDSIQEELDDEEDMKIPWEASAKSHMSPLANRHRSQAFSSPKEPSGSSASSQGSQKKRKSQRAKQVAFIREFKLQEAIVDRVEGRSATTSSQATNSGLSQRRSSQRERSAAPMEKISGNPSQTREEVPHEENCVDPQEPRRTQPSPSPSRPKASLRSSRASPQAHTTPAQTPVALERALADEEDEFSDIDLPNGFLEPATKAQSPAFTPAPVTVQEPGIPKEADRVIPDSEDEFGDEEDFLLELSASALQNHSHVPAEEEIDILRQEPEGQQTDALPADVHFTQSIFSMSQLEASPTPSPRKFPVKKEHSLPPPPPPPPPPPVTMQQEQQPLGEQQLLQEQKFEDANGNDAAAEDEDLFSSSFPMTQCESLISQAQALKTPARTFPLPPRPHMITPAPVLATAPAPQVTTSPMNRLGNLKDDFNVGSSFFDDDGLSDDDDDGDEKTIKAPASPRDYVVAPLYIAADCVPEESSHDYGDLDGLDESLLADIDQLQTEIQLDGNVGVQFQSSSQASSSSYGDITPEEASLLDCMDI